MSECPAAPATPARDARVPRVSIGMPVRNGARYVRQAIDSLLAQTFADFELIICDNASTDSTEAICRAYQRRDARVSYHRNERDVGPAENYNRCFHLGRAPYFKWAAHDDVCLPTYLARCVEVLDRHPDVVNCHSHTRVIDEDGNYVGEYRFRTTTDSRLPSQRFGRLINVSHRRHVGYEIFGVMRRSVMESIPPQGRYAHADRIFLVRMCLRGKFHEVPEPLFLARRHAAQSMAARDQGALRAMLAPYIGAGPLPPPEWWDASLRGKPVFPDWKLIREYYASLDCSDLPLGERVRSEFYLALWFVKYWPKLARDLLFAGETLLARRRRPTGQTSCRADENERRYVMDQAS